MTKELTHSQAMRFNRQILMPEFDIDKQEKLLNSHALLVGLGGLGCACSQYLVATGIGAITLLDDDQVELTNLPRQILHTDKDVGMQKVDSARETLQTLNPDIQITTLNQRLDDSWLQQTEQHFDIVIDCSDNLTTRNLANQYCFEKNIPLISGAAIRMEGQVSSFIPEDQDCPCYQCISHYFGEQNLSCVESGILSPVIGIIGAMQALEAVKVLTHFGQPLTGRLQLFDALAGEWQSFKVPKRTGCPVCHNQVP